jgi:hypothetical protein
MNPLTLDETVIQGKLVTLFDGEEWVSYRQVFFKKNRDYCSFATNNIILTLKQCRLTNERLQECLETAIHNLKRYQREHLVHYWPLEQGKSKTAAYNLFSRIFRPTLSPDADDSCLQALILRQEHYFMSLLEELTFHRINHNGFKLIEMQNRYLNQTDSTFLTWFAKYRGTRLTNKEQVDVVVDANILWFLKEFGYEKTAGYNQTIEFIRWAINSGIILYDPFIISPYYGEASLELFLISRAIIWGRIEELYAVKEEILRQAGHLKPRTMQDYLCLLSTFILWGERESLKLWISKDYDFEMKASPFSLGPYLMGWSRWERLARSSIFQIKFESEPFLWAILLWVVQKLNQASISNPS